MKENKGSSILIAALVIILFFGGIAGAYYIGQLKAENNSYKELVGGGNPSAGVPGQPENQQDAEETAKNAAEVTDNDHIRGSKDAKIALIEYSDYQCPFCSSFHSTAEQALEEYGDSLMWVYRHFPLDGLHPQARYAAEASECIAEVAGNDAFWTYTDKIFSNQESINTDSDVTDFALQTNGVDKAAFDSCIESGTAKTKVQNYQDDGAQAGIQGTPGVIVRNIETGDVRVLPGAVPISQVKAAVDSLLE